MKQELLELLRADWLMVTLAIVLFAGVVAVMPYTDLGKTAREQAHQYEMGQAIYYNSLGMLSPQDKQYYTDKYGLTEDDWYPLEKYIDSY